MKKFLILSLIYVSCLIITQVKNSYATEPCISPNFLSCNTDLFIYTDNQSTKKVDNAYINPSGESGAWQLGTASKTRPINYTSLFQDSRAEFSEKAYVEVNGNELKWYEGRTQKNTIFGKSSSHILTGCDFTGDGESELVVVNGKNVQYKNNITGRTSSITLPKSSYNYIICADVLGNGTSQIIAKKQVTVTQNRVTKKVWKTDVIDKNSRVRYKNITFGGNAQGNIIALDINDDGRDEIGFVKKASSTRTQVIFLNNISKPKAGVTKYTIPRLVSKTNGVFDISPAVLNISKNFYYKTKDGFYNYNITTNKNEKFEKVARFFPNVSISKIKMVKKSELFQLTSSSSGGGSTGKVQCDVNRARGNGFLWKGVGEAYGHVSVAIMPIYNRASSCQVVASDGSNTIGMWVSSQSANPWKGVGRQHWRAKATCKSMKTPSTLRCQIGGKSHCWSIPSPCARLE